MNLQSRSTHNKFRIMQQNLRKSVTATDEAKEVLDSFKNNKVDIVLVQEPYCFSKKVIFNSYSKIFYKVNNDNNPSNAIIIMNPNLSATFHDDLSNDFCTTISVQTKRSCINICNFYIQPNKLSSTHITFIQNILLQFQNKPLLLCGDFNARSQIWHDRISNRSGRLFADIFNNNNLHIHNDQSNTFENAQGSSIIDLTISNAHLTAMIQNWNCQNHVTLSDHSTITFDININNDSLVSNRIFSTWKYSEHNPNWDLFRSVAEPNLQSLNTELDKCQCIEDIDAAITKLNSSIMYAAQNSLPRKKRFNTRTTIWSPELDALKSHFKYIRRKYYQGKSDEATYKAAKYKYQYKRDKLRNQNFKTWIEENNSQNAYGNCYKLMKRKVNPTKNELAILDKTEYQDKHSVMINLIDTLFPSDNTNDDTTVTHMIRLHSTTSQNYATTQVSEDELLHIVSKLNNKKAPGRDNISNQMIKVLSPMLVPILTKIFNKCFSLEYFPIPWKAASIIVLPKPNKTEYMDPKSYRPISLISNIGKLLERVLKDRIEQHLTTNNLLDNRIHGFVKQKSTITALEQITNTILEKKKGYKVALISLDISAAFDNAIWAAILKNLDEFNAPIQIINMIKSYFSDRKICFSHSDFKTNKITTKGCPQGGVISPMLWNLAISSLLASWKIHNSEISIYADDISIVCWETNLNKLKQTIINNLAAVNSWCTNNKLVLNNQKTNILYFRTNKKPTIVFEGHRIPAQSHVKILGVKIAEHRSINKLSFHQHINDIKSKITRIKNALFSITKRNWGLNYKKRITIYKGALRPIITYASNIWFCHLNNEDKNTLNRLQNSILVNATCAFKTTSIPILHSLTHILSLTDHIDLESRKLPKEVKQIETLNILGNYLSLCNYQFRIFFPNGVPTHIQPSRFFTQLLSGHAPTNEYFNRFFKDRPATCPCGEMQQTSWHLITECSLLAHCRPVCISNNMPIALQNKTQIPIISDFLGKVYNYICQQN